MISELVQMRCSCGATYLLANRRLRLREVPRYLRHDDPRVIGDHERGPACGRAEAVPLVAPAPERPPADYVRRAFRFVAATVRSLWLSVWLRFTTRRGWWLPIDTLTEHGRALGGPELGSLEHLVRVLASMTRQHHGDPIQWRTYGRRPEGGPAGVELIYWAPADPMLALRRLRIPIIHAGTGHLVNSPVPNTAQLYRWGLTPGRVRSYYPTTDKPARHRRHDSEDHAMTIATGTRTALTNATARIASVTEVADKLTTGTVLANAAADDLVAAAARLLAVAAALRGTHASEPATMAATLADEIGPTYFR